MESSFHKIFSSISTHLIMVVKSKNSSQFYCFPKYNFVLRNFFYSIKIVGQIAFTNFK